MGTSNSSTLAANNTRRKVMHAYMRYHLLATDPILGIDERKVFMAKEVQGTPDFVRLEDYLDWRIKNVGME